MLNAANYQTLDKRPDFINLSPQALSQQHKRQANLGQDAATVSVNYIDFNLDALNTIKGDKGNFYNIKNTQMSGQEIALRLPNVENPVLLYVDNVQNLVKGVVTYTGYRVEDVNDFFTLSVSDDAVMAKINYGKYIYVIRPIKSKTTKHTIVQLEKALMVKDTGDDVIESKTQKVKNFVEKSGNGSGHVKVLFYFAADVWFRNLYTSIIISEMNAALTRSGVSSNNRIFSAGIKSVSSTFPNQCKDKILIKMRDATNEFSNIDQDLVVYGADVAALLVRSDINKDCGLGSEGIFGRFGGMAVPYNQNNPFTVIVDTYALVDLTALHEIGHIFGGAHAYPVNYPGRYSYSKGLIYFDNSDPDDSWQTIMGSYGDWYDDCVFNGPRSPCERINYFSNPNLTYNGIAIGSPSRNMKRSLNNTMPVVSSWRGVAESPPNAPNPTSLTPSLCYGLNTINWTAQSGATEYKLYKSTNSNFTAPTLQYTGSNTTAVINVSWGAWYLRAKACNASGCSAYSNQVAAYRVNGCL